MMKGAFLILRIILGVTPPAFAPPVFPLGYAPPSLAGADLDTLHYLSKQYWHGVWYTVRVIGETRTYCIRWLIQQYKAVFCFQSKQFKSYHCPINWTPIRCPINRTVKSWHWILADQWEIVGVIPSHRVEKCCVWFPSDAVGISRPHSLAMR